MTGIRHFQTVVHTWANIASKRRKILFFCMSCTPQKKWLVSFSVSIEIYLLTSVPLYPVTQLQIFFNVS